MDSSIKAQVESKDPKDFFDPEMLDDINRMETFFEEESLRIFKLKKQYEAEAKRLYAMEMILKEKKAQQCIQQQNAPESQIVPKVTVKSVPKATRANDDHLLSQICIVLVRTEGAVNVGQICRIAANLGVTDIRLVTPICDHFSSDGRRFANHAVTLLSSLPIYDTIDDALTDVDLVIGTSARDVAGSLRGCKFIEPQEVASTCIQENMWGPSIPQIENEYKDETEYTCPENYGVMDGIQRIPKKHYISSPKRIALMFGNEASGLNHDELSRANYCVYIPTRGTYPSLNLTQAVTTLLFSIWLTGHKKNFIRSKESKDTDITHTIATSQTNTISSSRTNPNDGYQKATRVHIERIRALFEATMHRTKAKSALSAPDYFHDSTLRLARICSLSIGDINLFFGALRNFNTLLDDLKSGQKSSQDLQDLEEEKFLLQSVLLEEKQRKKQEQEEKSS